MKKVLLISNETSLNGAPRSLFEIAKGCKHRFNFTFLLPDDRGDLLDKLNEEKLSYIVFKNIKKLYTKNFIKRIVINIILFFEITRFLKKEQFDIIHLNTSAVRFAVFPVLFSKSKVICHIREYYKNYLKTIIIKLLYSLVADKIVVNSLYLKKKFSRNAIVVYNGIEVNKIKNIPIPEEKRILFVGRITKEKGVDDLINAISNIEIFDNLILDLVGYCDDLLHYKNLIEIKHLKNNVILHGFKKNVDSYLDNATMLILPSHRESFGKVILESFAHSRPVIATNIGGIPEIVDEKCGILIPCGDINSLTKAIVTLINNKEMASEMGNQGLNKVIKKFAMRNYVEKINQIYNCL